MKTDKALVRAIFQDISDAQAKQRASEEAIHIGTLLHTFQNASCRIVKVLNVGCGLGRHDRTLRKLDYKVHSIDIGPSFVKMAKERNRGFEKYYKVGSMTNLPYGKNSFDAVLCLFSTFNIMNGTKNKKALGEFRRVLKDDGLLIMDLETKRKPNSIHTSVVGNGITKVTKNRVVGNYLINDETLFANKKQIAHIVDKERLYSPGEMRALCKKNGFDVLRMYKAYTKRKLSAGDSQMMVVAKRRATSQH